MRQFIIILMFSIISTPALAYKAYKYDFIDSPNLEQDARIQLRKQYPSLTSDDINLLYPYMAVRLYNKERGITDNYI